MAGYIIVDVKTRKTVGICAIVAVLLFVIGIIIGYFSGKGVGSSGQTGYTTLAAAVAGSCPLTDYTADGRKYVASYLRTASDGVCVQQGESCDVHELPRTYIAYHLQGETISIDGRLDDKAWTDVPWTDDFVDIRSDLYPRPRLDTKVKVRWDNTRLYIGAYLQETDLWGTITQDDTPIYKDNDFEVLMDVDGTMHNYKQMQINVLNASWDLMYYTSPYDTNTTGADSWSAGMQKAVHYVGTLNVPGDTDKYWSVEWSFTFEALANASERQTHAPDADEVWFMNFGRAEWPLTVTQDNKYAKVTEDLRHDNVSWWTWNPCGSVNLLLQNRWGLVQFKRNIHDKTFHYKYWHLYKALFDVFDGMLAYKGVNGNFINQIEELNVPPYLFSRRCVDIPSINVTRDGATQKFEVAITSRMLPRVIGHIRTDRYVWLEK